ncbi:Nrd1 complex RNA-binding subunit [Aphanomyces cochlioides]|nr:Nrd1 complex RNA-binding subunit [Aphanomyces cochlioides]
MSSPMPFNIDSTKSPNDKKQYRLITLDNELQALLIQFTCDDADNHSDDGSDSYVEDEEEDEDMEEEDGDDGSAMGSSDTSSDTESTKAKSSRRAGACLTVGVGSFAEPGEIGGLAHFLEHMLFMGSEKYPDENSFEAFLSAHGGYSNGETDCEWTRYMFEVGPNHLEHALDMFAQFFIGPLMKADAMDRELSAIESEFNQATQSDQIRFQQVLTATSDPTHPFHRFNWGNTKSLQEIPAGLGIDVRDSMLRFYENYYSSNLMKLVVCGQDSLDDMELWTRRSFGPIKNKHKEPPVYFKMASPFGNNSGSSLALYKIVPLKDTDAIFFHWYLPPLIGVHRMKPHEYVASIIGHESEGSILYLLKKLGWATSISAGLTESHGYDYGTFGCIFTVEIKLTYEGFSRYDQVVAVVFQYLNMMRSTTLPAWFYEEAKTIADLDFQFQEDESAIEKCEDLAVLMQKMYRVPPEDLLSYETYKGSFDATLVEETVLSHLNVSNLKMHLVSKAFSTEASTFIEEPWFGVKYAFESISKEKWSVWSCPAVNSKLHYPLRNPFIPTDLSMLDADTSKEGQNPRSVFQNENVRVWYKPDNIFRTPRAHVACYINIPSVISSSRSIVATQLFVRMVKDALNAYSYHAEVAQLYYELRVKESGIELIAGGFNDKLPELVYVIAQSLVSLEIRDDNFNMAKSDLSRYFNNSLLKLESKSTYLRLQLIQETSFPLSSLIDELNQMSVERLGLFVREDLWKGGANVVGMVHGNLSEASAIQLVTKVSGIISEAARVCPMQAWIPRLVRQIGLSDKHIIWEDSEHQEEVNTLVEHYFQMSNHTIIMLAVADLIQQIMDEPLFDVLRTKKQLGYEVSCSVRVTHGILGYSIKVISSSAPTSTVSQAIDDFLNEFKQTLENMSSERLNEYIQAQIQIKNEPDINMTAASMRYWGEIIIERFAFELNKDIAKWLQSGECGRDLLLHYFDTWFGEKSRKLQIYILGKNSATRSQEFPPQIFLTSKTLFSFKAKLPLFDEVKSIC